MGKRTKILNAAEILLAERGFYGLSMKLLADTAGVAAGTIYRYFENKEALINELRLYIIQEVSKIMFNGWSENQTPSEKYNLLWRNVFDAVRQNPQRLTVIEMLSLCPNLDQENNFLFEDQVFLPLFDFYQQGIDEGRLRNWQIPALVALSLDSAVNLAKKVLKQHLQVDEIQINQVRDASWLIIQNI